MYPNRFFASHRNALLSLAVVGLGGSQLWSQPALDPPAPFNAQATAPAVAPSGPAVAPLTVPSAGASVNPAAAEWLEDYKKALEESQALGKPLLVLFVSSECLWCQKLARETLVEPNIKARLKSHWVCVKVDGVANRALAESLKVRSVPAMILANPKGAMMARLEGFQNPQALGVQLDRVRFQWEAESELLTNLFRDAVSKIRQGDFASANSQLARVLENPVNITMRQEAAYLVDLLKKGEPNTILRIPDQPFQEILTKYGITQGEAPGALASRSVEKNSSLSFGAAPNDLLQMAREDLAKKQVAAALDKLEWLGQQKPDSTEAVQAQKLVQDLRNNTESLRSAVEQMQEKLTQALLQLAETNLAAGEPQQAVACLEQVVRVSPNSRHAEIAQTRMAQLQGQPSQAQTAPGLPGRPVSR